MVCELGQVVGCAWLDRHDNVVSHPTPSYKSTNQIFFYAGQCWLNNRLDTGAHVYGTHCATNYVIANHWSYLRGF